MRAHIEKSSMSVLRVNPRQPSARRSKGSLPERAKAYLADPTNLLLVAIDRKMVIGQCAACIHRHPDRVTELYVDNLGVADGYKRRGFGRELITRMFSEGKARGCDEAWVGTEVDNDPANRLYEQFTGESVETFNLHSYKL
jgi:ribosomal protein S18 acetylase RimI-like enzyme